MAILYRSTLTVVFAVVVALLSTFVESQEYGICANQFIRSCNETNTTVGVTKCCSWISQEYSTDKSCLCFVFNALHLNNSAELQLLDACGVVTTGVGTVCPAASSTSRGGGVNPVASPKGAPVPPSVSPSAGSVGSPPAPPSQSPTSSLPPRPSASSPSAAGSVESPPAPPSQSPTSSLPPRPSASPSAAGSVESPPAPPSGGPNSTPPPTEGQTSGHSPKNDFPPESPLPETKAAPPPSEGWRPKTFFNSFGLAAMYLFCVFIVA